jgi:hypothetical protein
MKVNLISNEIDETKLNKEINYYVCTTNQEPYLFMNKDTANAIGKQHNLSPLETVKNNSNIIIGRYMGNRVYINDDLTFGEVEIR